MTRSGGYDPQHFAELFAVEDRHFWFRARNSVLAHVTRDIVRQLPSGHRVLEVGCGTGNTLRMLIDSCPDARVIVGLDAFEEGLRYARRRTAGPLVRARVEQAPFGVLFDMVGMFDVLEHIPDDAGALRHLRTLLTRQGFLALTVPADKALWSRFDEESHHCRRYDVDGLRAVLTDAGFRVEYLTPFMASLYPVAKVGRWVAERINGVRNRLQLPERSAVGTDLTVRPVLNELAALILRLETRVLWSRGRLRPRNLAACRRPSGIVTVVDR